MKKMMIPIVCLLMSAATNAQDMHTSNTASNVQTPAVDANAGKFQFKEETHDYGNVPEGPKAECDFEFTNVGKKPIVITNAVGSCGCTVPTWPKNPVLPGQTAKIHVEYNTAGRQGAIQKSVTVFSNAIQQPMTLQIKGSVMAAATGSVPSANAPVKL